MPFYSYHCSNCDLDYQLNVPMSEYDKQKPCTNCSALNDRVWKPTTNFILKGDGWAGKNERIKNQMKKKNERLDARQNEMKRDQPNVTLAPNVDGERVDSWSEARSLAASKGKNTQSYDAMVAKEKASK